MPIEHVLQFAKGKKLPDWVPKVDPNKPETTGFIPVDSSWIAGLRYTPDRGAEMTVKKGGKNYPYPGFNLAMFRRWVAAKSKGKWWWRNVGHVMMGAGEPVQLSRWTGQVHPLMNESADGPPKMAPFSTLSAYDIMQWLHRHWGKHVTPQHVAALTGWLPGTELHAFPVTSGGMNELHVSADSNFENQLTSQYSAHRVLGFHPKLRVPYIQNDAIHVGDHPQNPYRGVSGPILLRQMRAAWEAGVPEIHWTAAQSDIHGLRGGLHWPLMGADGILPRHYLASLPQDIVRRADEASGGAASATGKISEFFKSPEFKSYYAHVPVSHQAFVSTAPGSYSRRAIEGHVAQHAARFGMAPPIPDHQMPKTPLAPLRMAKMKKRHPMSEHLIATGQLHPDFFDEYFEN